MGLLSCHRASLQPLAPLPPTALAAAGAPTSYLELDVDDGLSWEGATAVLGGSLEDMRAEAAPLDALDKVGRLGGIAGRSPRRCLVLGFFVSPQALQSGRGRRPPTTTRQAGAPNAGQKKKDEGQGQKRQALMPRQKSGVLAQAADQTPLNPPPRHDAACQKHPASLWAIKTRPAAPSNVWW